MLAAGSSLLPFNLHPKQAEFVEDDRLEILYGGAAGGGKSVALIAAALKYVHIPGYAAVLVRRAYSHLNAPPYKISNRSSSTNSACFGWRLNGKRLEPAASIPRARSALRRAAERITSPGVPAEVPAPPKGASLLPLDGPDLS